MQNNNNRTTKAPIKRSKEENSAIRSSLNLQYRTTHPCVSQGMECPFSSGCCFCGLPNDACLFFLIGKCKYNPCRNKHYQNFKDKVLPVCQQYSLQLQDSQREDSISSSSFTCHKNMMQFNLEDMEAMQQRMLGPKLNKEISVHHLKEIQSNSFSLELSFSAISIEVKRELVETVSSIKQQDHKKSRVRLLA